MRVWGLILLLVGLWALGGALPDPVPDLAARLQPPTAAHPFGTDALGRDLLTRSLQGLAVSLWIGTLGAGAAVMVACAVVGLASLGRWGQRAADFLTDVTLALPHLLLLLLIAFTFGGGAWAVILAVGVSHWPRLARLLQTEARQTLAAPYVEVARALGRGRGAIWRDHLLPQMVPQAGVGFVLMFPHAILHEAALSFLGFGLDPAQPSIGLLLAEAMRHLLAGRWWLGLCPGLLLLAVVLGLEALGSALRRRGGQSC